MKGSKDHYKILKAATLYYQEGLTQAEIGKRMQISRPVVSKLIQQARESGMVEIYIKNEDAYAVHLSVLLEEKYQLKEVVVISNAVTATDEQKKKNLAFATVSYLIKKLPKIRSIGISWGTTLARVIDELPYIPYPDLSIVPLVGGLTSEHLYFDTNHLVFQLSQKLNSRCQYFYAPALAESKEVAITLNQTKMIQKAVLDAAKVDLALIGVGNPIETSTWQRLGYLREAELTEIKDTQVVGDAIASLFDKNGKTVNNTISERMIGLKVEDLKNIPEVAIIGAGQEKTASIHGLLMGDKANVLIIDQQLAESLLNYEEKKEGIGWT